MPLVFSNLPLEIIELISFYCNTVDLSNAIRVSKSWHHVFYTSLYKYITFDDYDKQVRILSAFQKNQLPGHHVRSINVSKIQLSLQEIESFPRLFPCVDSITFDWRLWGSYPFEAYFDKDAPISFIHPPRGLPIFIDSFFSYYGSKKLKRLSINALNHEATDVWSILALCPQLTQLELINLNHEHIITLSYIDTIHQYCPRLFSLTIKCTRSDPSPNFLPPSNHGNATVLKSFSLSSKTGSAKWPLWLPYFSIKYPYMQHIFFKHCGLGKDEGEHRDVLDTFYASFAHGCRQLKSIRWSKIIVQHHQQQMLFSPCCSLFKEQKQLFPNLRKIEAYENFLIPNSIQHSPIVKHNTLMSNLLTSLTITQPPAIITTTQVMEAIGQCKRLIELKIQGCFVNHDIAYYVDDILHHCRGLRLLYFKDSHIGVKTTSSLVHQHPLQKLVFKRSSFTQDMFPYLSAACASLEHVDLLGCFQVDRRDRVVLDLSLQSLTTLKIQGLRTRSFYAGCRIRFFFVDTKSNEHQWYYMTRFDIRHHAVGQKVQFKKYRNMEFARTIDMLDTQDVENIQSLVTKETLKAWDIEAATRHLNTPHTDRIDPTCWDPENIYYSGFLHIKCQSIQSLVINNKLIVNY